jgi:LysR family nitrogen assimilation transcriptional regulator
MDIARLRYFVKIAQRRSFRRAADELHIAQPALSRQVRLLEDELGVRLLTRNARGVTPTEAGMALLYGAERLFEFSAELRARVCSMAVTPAGRLRVGVQPSFATHFLTNVIVELRREHPELHFHITEAFSARLRDLVLADQLDLAVVSGLGAHPDLSLAPLYSEEIWLTGCTGQWKPPRKRLQPSYLIGRPILASGLMKPIAERAVGAENLVVAVEVDGAGPIAELVRQGVGLYFGPPTILWNELKSGQFVSAPLEGLHMRRDLIRRKDRPESAASALFISRIMAGIRRFSTTGGSPISSLAATQEQAP